MSRVVIVGGGTVGLAAAMWIARAGHDTLVLERFSHIHTYGSHGGHTRVIRRAYFEGSVYVPLVNRAMELWCELRTDLVEACGVIIVGDPADANMRAAVEATRASGVPHEVLRGPQVRQRWPLEVPDGWEGLWSPTDGYLRVDRCLHALRDEARAAGAAFRYDARVQHVDDEGVELEDGERVPADQIVVAAGAYTAALFPELLEGRLCAQRRVLTWTEPRPDARLREMPVWASFEPEGLFYGFPWRDEGVDGFKLALHPIENVDRTRDAVDPETVDREIHASDLEVLDAFLARRLPAGVGPHCASQVCLYGSTPTGDFIVDRHPDLENVVLVAGLSGHGFKFAPALGEVIAGIVHGGEAPEAFGLSS